MAALAAVHALIGLHLAHWAWAGTSLAPLELSESLHTVHGGVVTAGAILFLIMVAATLRYGRVFCGWGCHFLAVQDLAAAGLARLGWRADPARHRALAAVPVALLGYLYGWPFVERALAGTPTPTLHVAAAGAPWASFWTDDLWRSMPGPLVAGLTFAVGGVALVAALGPRAFCATVCPYGVVFGAAEQLAPRRVALVGPCSGCARCSAVCLSGIDVLAQLRAGGAVRDPACLRDLDCVAACPKDALAWVDTPLRRVAPPAAARPPWGEELLVGGTVLAGFLALRGLFGAVPVFLALSTSVLVAAVGIANVRRWREGGRVARGVGLAALVVPLGWAGVVRAHEAVADRAELAARAGDVAAAGEAITALEAARRWSPWCPPIWRSRLASLHLARGDLAAAEAELTELVRVEPGDEAARRVLERVREARRQDP